MTSSDFAEIHRIVATIPKIDEGAEQLFWARDAVLTKPPGALGRLERIGAWFVGWQGKYPARFLRPRISIYAGNHGVAAQGVSAYGSEVTAQMVKNFRSGGAVVNQLALLQDADLKVHEMALEEPTADFTKSPAMSEQRCCEAIAYGMVDAAEGVDILALGEMGIANSTAAAALCHALYGGEAADWVGAGTGVSGKVLAHKVRVVERAVQRHREVVERGNGLEILRIFGGLELAGIVGAVLAARIGRIPVVLDGYACTAAAAILTSLHPEALDHCLVGHLSKEPGHRLLLEKLDKKPILDLEMGLGEASGAALALSVVKAAVSIHNGMASFEEASVSNRD